MVEFRASWCFTFLCISMCMFIKRIKCIFSVIYNVYYLLPILFFHSLIKSHKLLLLCFIDERHKYTMKRNKNFLIVHMTMRVLKKWNAQNWPLVYRWNCLNFVLSLELKMRLNGKEFHFNYNGYSKYISAISKQFLIHFDTCYIVDDDKTKHITLKTWCWFVLRFYRKTFHLFFSTFINVKFGKRCKNL